MAELTEVVAEAADEVAETATHVAEVSRALSSREVRIAVVAIGLGVTGGVAVGYYIAKRRLRTEYIKIAEDEIQVLRDHFREKLAIAEDNVVKARQYWQTQMNAAKPELDKVMEQLGYQGDPKEEVAIISPDEEEVLGVVEEEPEPDPVEVFKNVFEASTVASENEWDYATEVKSRDPDVPYVIHADEHAQNEKEYRQAMLTYYEGDDVLADDQDNVVDDQDETVGVQNLGKFGHGSGDPQIVYVRNDELGVDYEIVKSDGSYAHEVHGFQHSEPKRRSRRKWDG